jgi:FeS assembly SUF system protein
MSLHDDSSDRAGATGTATAACHQQLGPEADPSRGPAEAGPDDAAPASGLEARVIDVMRTVYDPEIPVNIYELGMVYGVDCEPGGKVTVRMTLTSPSCPVAGTLPGEVQARIAAMPEVSEARVELVWDPPWEPSRMSEAARLELGFF